MDHNVSLLLLVIENTWKHNLLTELHYFSAPKRMTWEMINQQNELNASIAAYSNQKQQIIQDFEKIKTEVIITIKNRI